MILKCANCDAELVPGTSFCRQCGEALSSDQAEIVASSEEPTVHFTQGDSLDTRRLEARSTSDRSSDARPQHISTHAGSRVNQTKRWTLLAGAVSLLLICLVGLVWFLTLKGRSNAGNTALIYPGAKTIVDMKYDDGSRAVHLETDDSLSNVEQWYQTNLKPAKTMRLTPGSVVLKSENKTITLVSENNKTSVLIKMAP